MNRPGGFQITERCLALCGFSAGARILDIGCGAGETVRHLREWHGLEAFGVDVDFGAIAERSHLLRAAGEALPFPDASFAGVFMECSLSVTSDPDQVLAECRRVLIEGGWLLVSDIYARGEPAVLGGCLGRVETLDMLQGRLAARGFRTVHTEDFSPHLRALWGQRIMEGGAAALCAELGADRVRLRSIECGYILIAARRSEP